MSQGPSKPDVSVAEDFSADVSAEAVAAVYAEALLGAAEKTGDADKLVEEFDSLVKDVLDRFPKLEAVWSSALVSHDEKLSLIDRLLGKRASPTMLNFLKVVSRHGRLDILRPIHRQIRTLHNQRRGLVTVRVTTATPLSDDLAAHIVRSLRGLTGGEPMLERVVDPQVIGGIVLKVGDTVYDGSIANQLEKLREQIIERSAHEIQSRRDRFRHSA